jgi:hypothetical protein
MRACLGIVRVLGVVAALFATGCSGKRVVSNSGFLGDQTVYEALKDHPEFEGVRVVRYQDPSVLKDSAFIVPPVKIYLSKEGSEREVPPEELAELAVFFRNEVLETLQGTYQITNIPGPDTRILRLAITDADPNLPALNIHPGTVISGAGLGGATIEMSVEDSATGQVIVAALASRAGARYNYAAGLTKWGHTKAVLEDFAKLIRQRLDEISSDKNANS